MQLPQNLRSGEIARLIPVIADSRKEQRAASVLLAVMSAVPDLAHSILSHFGQRVGSRSSVNTFTEISFPSEQGHRGDRPDGMVVVQTGSRAWSALFEVKIGSAELELDQIERYLHLARDNAVDALNTISNQFAALPTHHPISVSKTLTRRVSLFHISWTAILTEAILLHENAVITDPEQAFLLREFVRFLSHDSVGMNGYQQMPPQWRDLTDLVQAGGVPSKSTPGINEIVAGWFEEVRDLSLQTSQILGTRVEVKLSSKHRTEPELRLKDGIVELCKTSSLTTDLRIPDSASDLEVCADLKTRTIRTNMTLDAPKDRKRNSARVNWLLRQLKETQADGISVHTDWASRAPDTVYPLATLRENPKLVDESESNAPIRALGITMHRNVGGKFRGRKTFIGELERLVPVFYEQVGQYLQAWHPHPPRPKNPKIEVQQETPEPTIEKPVPMGNFHTELLDIPAFLRNSTVNQ